MIFRVQLPAALMAAIFAVVPAYAGGAVADGGDEPPALVATGDFNRDGIADVAKITDGDGSGRHFLTVLLGQADGSFRTVASHNAVGGDPHQLVVGDLNGDGNPDVIVGDSDGALLEFLGDGRGNMTGGRNIAAFGSVASVAMGRFTKGGNLDLVVSDVRSNTATILLGGGDGSFRLTWSFDLPKRGVEFHVATADFNKDGIVDIVIMSEDNDNYEVMLGNGNGTFTYAPELSHLRDPYSYCPS